MSAFLNHVGKYLVPPGQGVYTVHTASNFKEILNESYYNTRDPKLAEKTWKMFF